MSSRLWAVAAVLALVLAGMILSQVNHSTPPAPLSAMPAVEREAAPQAAGLDDDGEGCLRPTRTSRLGEPVERSDAIEWQTTAAADRLRVDRCGSVWGLWFNSWSVSLYGDPAHIGHVAVPNRGRLAGLARSGVAAFLPAHDATLWIVGNNGELARYRQGGWQRLPAPERCTPAALELVDGDVWLACGSSSAPLSRWDEQAQSWLPVAGTGAVPIARLAVASDGLLFAAGAGALGAYDGGPEQPWRWLAQTPAPTALAADDEHVHVGSEDGLHSFDRRGRPLGKALAGDRISGVVATGNGRIWASVVGGGLRHFDGRSWHEWRFAHGLPDDEGRDVLLDDRGRLWLAGSVGGVLDERQAARRIVSLADPPPIDGNTFDDACAAADALLGERDVAGHVARQRIDGRMRVFFDGHQVCPDPWNGPRTVPLAWRRGDGAIVEVASNGHRGHVDCGSPCTDEQRRTMAPLWQVRVHRPLPGGRGLQPAETLPLPDPLPTQSPHSALLLGGDDTVWIGTRDRGLYQYDGRRWRQHQADDRFDRGNGLVTLLEDASGTVWAGAHPRWLPEAGRHAGAALYRWRNGRWSTPDADEPLSRWSTLTLTAIDDGIAIGSNGGMAEITSSGIRVIGSDVFGQRAFVATLAQDPQQAWWVGHGSFDPGISRLQHGQLMHATSRNGLFADRIRRIAVDDADRLWLLESGGRVAVYPRAALAAALHR